MKILRNTERSSPVVENILNGCFPAEDTGDEVFSNHFKGALQA